MKIAACMSWYDERPDTLRLWVEQVHPFADVVIAHDGAWDLFPNGKPRSPYRQRKALRDSCAAHGLELHLRTNGDLWPSEVGKRSTELRFASETLTAKDWILRLDADEYTYGHPKELRRYLRSVSVDVVTVMFHESGQKPFRLPRLIRALPGLTVRHFHHFVYADGKYLVGSRRNVLWYSAPRAALEIEHLPQRSDRRLADKAEYYRQRDMLQVETETE